MRKAVLLFAVVAALAVVLAPAGSAGNSIGAGAQAACSFGSCFAPFFSATGQTNTYAGPAASAFNYADCCIAGDTYKVTIKGPGSYKSVTSWKSSGALATDCTAAPYPDSNWNFPHLGGTSVAYKSIKLPGGVPANAFLAVNNASWAFTGGPGDSC
jgi:hypothetical protein